MFHRFPFTISPADLPRQFTYPFCYTPHPLVQWAAKSVADIYRPKFGNKNFGKMFGILLVRNETGEIGYLAAYSGEMKDYNNFFVPPIVDYLNPDGYFKIHNDKIVALNNTISEKENSIERCHKAEAISVQRQKNEEQIEIYRQMMKKNKQIRAEQRTHIKTEAEELALIKQSQFEKAELKRLEKRLNDELRPLIIAYEEDTSNINRLKKERHQLSTELQEWLFEQYTLLNARGEEKRLDVIFKDAGRGLPPSGAGDCCAPRLLQYAYINHFTPLAMGEFWVGASIQNVMRVDGQFYPSCQRKCKPILSHMLIGLDVEPNPLQKEAQNGFRIVYEDQWIVVINKPGGLQSIPGLTTRDSVSERLQIIYPNCNITPVHRLDQFTSGLLIIAKSKEVLSAMQKQFENRQVKKRYVALLEHRPVHDSGIVSLPIGYDAEDSCKRMVDFENGKASHTRYRVIGQRGKYTLVEYYPETGRTHQLRIHSAHPDGLNAPIVGDGLYGTRGDVMYLCSCGIQFQHPITNDFIKLELPEKEWFL